MCIHKRRGLWEFTSESVEFARVSNGEEDKLVRDGDDGCDGEVIVVQDVNRHFGFGSV